jgi:hypothetical protein
LQKPDAAVAVDGAEDQELALEARDLLGAQVDRGDHHATDQVLFRVMGGLRAGRALAYVRTEVDRDLVGGFARLGEGIDRHDAPGADIESEELFGGDVGLSRESFRRVHDD